MITYVVAIARNIDNQHVEPSTCNYRRQVVNLDEKDGKLVGTVEFVCFKHSGDDSPKAVRWIVDSAMLAPLLGTGDSTIVRFQKPQHVKDGDILKLDICINAKPNPISMPMDMAGLLANDIH